MSLPSAEEFVRIAAHRLMVINEASRMGDSAVQQFYRGAVVLLSGGTGFLGKQLVEKLLRTCDVKKVYLLLRCKRDKTANQRLQDMLANNVFETVRAVVPRFADKIQAVAGDVTETNLGMAQDTWAELTETVTVVFHCAATISFVEPLRKATETNVRGTLEMLNFGKACKTLGAFVHVSSTYSQAITNHHLAELPEQFSPSPVSPMTLLEMVDKNVATNGSLEGRFTELEEINDIRRNALNDVYARYIGKDKKYPNTYVFTKAVSEEAVRTMSGDMPVCIVRPSIVITAYTEPTPGWLDGSHIIGASGFIMNMVYGVTHAIIADPATKMDIVPVDFVGNAILAAAWDTARRSQRREKDIRIYSVSSSYRNHITWGTIATILFTDVRRHLSPSAMWYAFTLLTTNTQLYSVLAFLLHVVPAYVADAALLLVGKRRIMANLLKKVNFMSEIFSYFFVHSWVFRDDNLLQMYRRMSATDRLLFNFDIASVDMKELVVLWNISIRKYILKEGLGGEERAKKRQFIFKMATFAIAAIYAFILYKLFSFVINVVL